MIAEIQYPRQTALLLYCFISLTHYHFNVYNYSFASKSNWLLSRKREILFPLLKGLASKSSGSAALQKQRICKAAQP